MSFGPHTSKTIIGTKSNQIQNKKIILCITGSVAAIKSTEIARELMRHGAEVYAVMSKAAQQIIHPDMVEWSTGNKVITKLTGQTEHVTYVGEHKNNADLILIAPSTANTIGKIACGIDDTPVTTVLTTGIGAGIPVIIAPAMHESMYKHPIVKENIEKLRSIGIEILLPRFEEEKAKIPGTKDVTQAVIDKLTSKKDMEDMKILITAGPTRAYLDAFRYITNPSSGKMGVSIAENALNRGAQVTLVYGPGTEKPPKGIKVINVKSTEEMNEVVINELSKEKYQAVILSAAAADYGPKEREIKKTPSGRTAWNIGLKPLPKIIENVKKVDPSIYVIGFKAEYDVSNDELVSRAHKRLIDANINLIVANDVARKNVGFGTDTNEVLIVDKNENVKHITLRSKREVAEIILNEMINDIT